MSDDNPSRGPNVVLIIMDDLAWGDLACHGNPHTNTPHLDTLHSQSTRLAQYCSGPLCTPARTSIMTGRYPYRTRAIDTYIGRAMIDPGEITLAQVLANAGYRTCISGKWHLGDCHPMRAMDLGFEESLVHNSGGLGQPGNVGCYQGKSGYFDPILMHNGQPGYCTDIFADHTIKFIEAHQDEPFFCYLATNAPHAPHIIGDEWWKKYDNGMPEKWARLYGMVENIDHNVGKVMATLDRLDLADDTIVIYTSDHGPCPSATADGQVRWNAGLRGTKGDVYEGGLRVPHLWRWPAGLKAGRDIDRIANPIDVLPTLASICGGQLPRDRVIDGVDLSPLMRGQVDAEQWPDRDIFVQWHRGDEPELYRNCMVRTQRWKLVDGKELYDLPADPSEQNDVAAAHPDIVERYRQKYETWFDDVSHTRADNYAPPRISIGHPKSPTTLLSRQDWRVIGKDSWQDDGFGYWSVEVARDCACQIEVTFPPAPGAGQVTLLTPAGEHTMPIAEGAQAVTFDRVALSPCLGRVEAWLVHGNEQRLSAREVIFQADP